MCAELEKQRNLGLLAVFGDQAGPSVTESVGLLTRCDSAGLEAVSSLHSHSPARSVSHSFEYFLG